MRRLKLLILIGLATEACLSSRAAQAQFFNPQFRAGQQGQDVGPGMGVVTNRMARRTMDRAAELVKDQKFADAAGLLQSILDLPEDNFLGPEMNVSLRTEASRALAALPKEGRDTYELQFGAAARQLLEESVRSRDSRGLSDVVRRFRYTTAGAEACYRAGAQALDRGEPLIAARRFELLRETPDRAARWEPMLSLQTAVSWGRAGRPERSQAVLLELKQATPSGLVGVGGREVPLFEREDQALAWLVDALGSEARFAALAAEDWTMFGGNPSRNARSADASPVSPSDWSFPVLMPFDFEFASDTARDEYAEVESALKKLERQHRDDGLITLPAAHPLIVGNTVVYRTFRDITAFDAATGRLVWKSVVTDPSLDELLRRLDDSSTARGPYGPRSPLEAFLSQRAWRDQTAGTLSSDGERLYAIESLSYLGPPGFGRNGGQEMADDNRLTAYDLRTGKIQWELGGPRGAGPLPLAGTFFLGAPLPHEGRLFCLGENSGEIRLYMLDPRDGRPEWTQSLVVPEVAISYHPLRRLAGLSPSLSGDILICPTGAGAVVAVDLTQRTLLWGTRYSTAQSYSINNRAALAAIIGGRTGQLTQDDSDRWVDDAPLVADGRILLTPRDAEALYCLDVLDGSVQWKQPRQAGLYVACVRDGNVYVVEKRQVRAHRLSDGRTIWEQPVAIPPPAGRGFLTDGFYHLPLETGEIATLNLDSSRIVARSPLPRGVIPGNLASAGGMIVSQSVSAVVGFRPIHAVREEIARALESNPEDARALALRGEMLLHQGKEQQALADLRQAVEQSGDDRARRVLVATLLDGMRTDFLRYRKTADEIGQIVQDPKQRSEFLRLYAGGLEQAGDRQGAFAAWLKLSGPETAGPELEQPAEGLRVRSDRWIRAKIGRLYEEASAAERTEMDREIALQLQSALDSRRPADALRGFLGYFSNHSIADEGRRLLIDMLDADEQPLELELELDRLRQSDDAALAGFATARLAMLWIDKGRVRDAAELVDELATRWSDTPCLEGKTGRELAESWRADPGRRRDLSGDSPWPAGSVEASELEGETVAERLQELAGEKNRHMFLQKLYPVETVGPQSEFLREWRFDVTQTRQSVIARDHTGRVRWTLPTSTGDAAENQGLAVSLFGHEVRSHGHLLVFSLGGHFIVVDILSDPDQPVVLWQRSLYEPTAPGANPFAPGGRRLNGRARPGDGLGRPVGSVYAVTADFICYQVGARLHAADPLTGDVLWTRSDISPNSEITGDRDGIIVLDPDGERILALRAEDGSELRTGTPPGIGETVATVGCVTVGWTDRGRQRTLSSVDLTTGSLLWKRTFEERTIAALAPDDEIAVVDPSGKLQILSIRTGEASVEQQLQPEPELGDLLVLRSPHQYVVMTARPSQMGRSLRTFSFGTRNQQIDGHAYGIDRATRETQWSRRIDGWMHDLAQSRNLPVLVFSRGAAQVRPGQAQARSPYAILMLDRRTGEVLHENLDAHPFQAYQLEADLDQRVIDVNFFAWRVRLQFPEGTDAGNEAQKPGEAESSD